MNKLFYLLPTFFILSCAKQETSKGHAPPDCVSPTNKKITNKSFLDLIFKRGSYWVFKDSLDTKFSDTLHFDNTQSVDFNRDRCNKVEMIYMAGWANWMPEHYYRNFMLTPDSFVTGDPTQSQRYLKMYLLKGSQNNPCFYYDSIFVYDRYYRNVVRSDTCGSYNSKNKVLFYINSEFGFLRTDVFDEKGKIICKRLLFSKKIIR